MSFKALLLAMCLAAAVSLPLVQAKEVSGVSLQSLVGRLKIATEKALTNAGFMTSVNIQTLQAFTIYLVSSSLVDQAKCTCLTHSRSLSVVLKSRSRMQITSERLFALQ